MDHYIIFRACLITAGHEISCGGTLVKWERRIHNEYPFSIVTMFNLHYCKLLGNKLVKVGIKTY